MGKCPARNESCHILSLWFVVGFFHEVMMNDQLEANLKNLSWWTQSKIVALALTAGKSPKTIFWDISTKNPYPGTKLSRNDYWGVTNGMKQVLFNNKSKKAQKWCNVIFFTIFISKLTIYSFFKKISHYFPLLGIPWPP